MSNDTEEPEPVKAEKFVEFHPKQAHGSGKRKSEEEPV